MYLAKTVLLSLFASFQVLVTLAQDSSTAPWRFEKQIMFWSKWQSVPIDAQISAPMYIKQIRQNVTQLPVTFDSITDNPLTHGATYIRLQTQFSYRSKVSLYADLFAEHRGVSYGLYSQKNIVVYPVLRLEVKDTLALFGKTIEISGKAGQFLDEKLDAGLMIYNMDLQGLKFRASYKNFIFQYRLYGDLYNGIGLNIDDLKSYSLQRQSADSTSLIGASYISARPPFYPLKNYFNLNVFGNKQFKLLNLYGQIGFRPLSYQSVFSAANTFKRSAFLVGADGQVNKIKWSYKWRAEVRHYGFLFNYEYFNSDLRYRGPATDLYTMYANTVGSFLYPLRKFDTPFSQWAVFTEYIGFNTSMVSWAGKYAYHVSPKLDVCLDHDLNYIHANQDAFFQLPPFQSNFFYPFYNLSVGYHPAENVTAKAGITNKAMNLDVSYPTHYLFTNLQLELSLIATFN